MQWWILELITAAILLAVVAGVGPVIKRFGKSYAGDVFRANPRTGKSYLVLMDFAYYLIFGAYILFAVRFTRDTGWAELVSGNQLQATAVRVGGLLILMGILHGVNVLSLPVIGRLFSINKQLDDGLPPKIEAA